MHSRNAIELTSAKLHLRHTSRYTLTTRSNGGREGAGGGGGTARQHRWRVARHGQEVRNSVVFPTVREDGLILAHNDMYAQGGQIYSPLGLLSELGHVHEVVTGSHGAGG